MTEIDDGRRQLRCCGLPAQFPAGDGGRQRARKVIDVQSKLLALLDTLATANGSKPSER